jgi:hypothetical protein
MGKESSLLTGSSATPPMDDVRALFIHVSRTFQPFRPTPFFAVELLFPMLIFRLHFPFQPLMKEFIRLGTQFIGYRDHADKLKGIPLLPLFIE